MSIIIEKSKLDKAVIKLSKMEITDSFLLFLANCDKMAKIDHFDISLCFRVTENGINTLLISPYTKKLKVLNLSGLRSIDLALLRIKKQLT